MRLSLLVIAVLAGPLASLATAGPGKVTSLQVPKGTRIRAAAMRDMNADGRPDLVVATNTWAHPVRRHLRIHLRRDGDVCFDAKPDFVRELVPGVVAFAVGDVENEPGHEVVFFTARGVYAWRPGGDEKTVERRLLSGDFLWQLPDESDTTYFWSGVRDVDGDGLDDLMFPEPGGYRIALQRRDGKSPPSFAALTAPRIPPLFGEFEAASQGGAQLKARRRARQLEVSIKLGGDAKPLDESELSVVDAVPVPRFTDWDGDGRKDLVALSGEALLVWSQRKQGGFERFPAIVQEFPVEMDQGRRFDLSFGAHSADLNGDRRMDCVILAGDRRSEDIRTQILVYLNGFGKGKSAEQPLFGAKGQPQQVLIVGGIVGAVELSDVDGDGSPDLVLGTVQIDTLDAIRAASSGKVEASLRVYLNRRGAFSRQPDLVYDIEIASEDIEEAGRRLQARFIPDMSGDGVRELYVRDGPKSFRIHLVRKTSKGLAVFPRALDEHKVGKRAEIEIVERGKGPPEIVIREGAQIHHVRYVR
ncbi:MAG: VCBS repeat-containing protein [Planctomycetota bacterium]